MIKKLKRVIIDEVEVVQFTPNNILEVAMFIGINFKDDNDMFKLKEEVVKQSKIFVKNKFANFGNYILRDNKGNLEVLDETGYKHLTQMYKEINTDINTEEYQNKKEFEKEPIRTIKGIVIDKENIEKIIKENFSEKNPLKIEIGSDEIKVLGKMAENLFGKDGGTEIINNILKENSENIGTNEDTKKENIDNTIKNIIEIGKHLKDILK